MDIVCTRKPWTRMGRMGETSKMIKVTGGKPHERFLTRSVVGECYGHFRLSPHLVEVRVSLDSYKAIGCSGSCLEGETEHSYDIQISTEQTVRDFVATIVHEMVHVNQWETGEWDEDGEDEADYYQYRLTDKLWKKGAL